MAQILSVMNSTKRPLNVAWFVFNLCRLTVSGEPVQWGTTRPAWTQCYCWSVYTWKQYNDRCTHNLVDTPQGKGGHKSWNNHTRMWKKGEGKYCVHKGRFMFIVILNDSCEEARVWTLIFGLRNIVLVLFIGTSYIRGPDLAWDLPKCHHNLLELCEHILYRQFQRRQEIRYSTREERVKDHTGLLMLM